MKQLFLSSICFLGLAVCGKSQENNIPLDTIKLVFENDKVKVTEYVSTPGKDVCGIGKHSHPAHLNIAFTDIKGSVTTADGKTQIFDIPAGSTIWSEADTHIAINNGSKPARLYIIEQKNQ